MAEREPRSPWSLRSGEHHPSRGISPGARSSPSRGDDGGHISGHVGKAASSPASLKRPTSRDEAGPKLDLGNAGEGPVKPVSDRK